MKQYRNEERCGSRLNGGKKKKDQRRLKFPVKVPARDYQSIDLEGDIMGYSFSILLLKIEKTFGGALKRRAELKISHSFSMV